MPANNGFPTWVTKIINEQSAIIDKIEADTQVKQWLKATLMEQFNLVCPICHLQGHEASNCSVNAQMYSKTRSKPEHQMAWWMVKQIGKQAQEDEKHERKVKAMKLLKTRKRETKLEEKKALLGLN